MRRSVANNLNDIGKDHPDVLIDVARRWWSDAGDARRALVRHALRSLVKQGHPAALEILGFGGVADVSVENVRIAPAQAFKGDKVTIRFDVRSTLQEPQRVLVDLRVHFVKASGAATPKVFKVKALDLLPAGVAACRKTVSLADLTTRRHYAGEHRVDVLLNGRVEPIGAFALGERPVSSPHEACA